MRPLVTTAVLHLVGTLTAGLALVATDATLAVAATAGVFALLVWFASLHTNDVESGLPLASTLALVGLTLTGRQPGSTALPLFAAQVVGAAVGGAALLGIGLLDVPATLAWDSPDVAVAAVVAFVVGLVASWSILAVDAGAPAAWWAVPALLGGAALNVALVAAAMPAVLVGLAVGGVLGWVTALVSGAAAVVGTAVGVYLVALVTPTQA